MTASENESEADEDTFVEDYIASRVYAFTKLIVSLDCLTDPDFKKEGLAMLAKVRNSIKAPSTAEITSLKGGKE